MITYLFSNFYHFYRYGITPMHLCLCQEHISRSCLQLLVENGARLYFKNSQSVAPFQLVSDDISPNIFILQKSIIDQAFAQIVPKQSNLANSNNKCASNNNNQTGGTGDNELSSLTSSAAEGLNQNTVNTNKDKTAFGVVSDVKFFKRKLQSKASNTVKSAPKDVYICLDNVSVKSNSASNNEDSIQSMDNFGGSVCAVQYKKSIAESIAPSIFQHNVIEDHVVSRTSISSYFIAGIDRGSTSKGC